MSKRTAMTEEQLVGHIVRLEAQAGGTYSLAVAYEQARAMDYYLGKGFGTEEEGRSQVVSSDVWDVVEGITPLVLKPFVASDDIVRFSPEGAEDEEAAEQESDYINYVVTQKNDIFETLVAWVKTGLLQKNGVVKYWWETTTRTSIERYENLSDDLFAAMLNEDNVQVVEHTEKPGDPQFDEQTGQEIPGEVTHDVVLRISQEHGYATYRVIPPEEFLISRDATSINPQKARFVEHRTKLTISDLREQGYDVEDTLSDAGTDDLTMSPQYAARRDQEQDFHNNNEGGDPASREVTLREIYVRVDFDGDGIAELRKVCIVGRDILANEEAEEIPFCAWTPYPQPFKFDGRCPADETIEIQKIKSSVLRQQMDNIYTINNNTRYVSSKVNIDDLLDNQIAGVVRVDGDVVGNHVMPAPVTSIGSVVMPMIEYFDSAKENRTGFTRYNQGTDSNSLNKTATGVRIIAEAGNERIGLVSRCFAEQGLKPLMLGMHGLCRRHGTKKETVKLRGKWVDVDPRGWKTRYDMSVSVGLGTADKQMQMQGAQLLLDKQIALMPSGIVTPKNMYEAGSKLAQALGEKNPDKYFTAPPDEPPKPPDPMENPDVLFKTKELKQKDREIDIKEQEFQLKQRESEANLLMGHGRFAREMHAPDPQESPATTPNAEPKADLGGADVLQALQALAQQVAGMQQQLAQLAQPAEAPAAPPEPMQPEPMGVTDGQA